MKNASQVRKNRRDRRHWDDVYRNSGSLGCSRCPDFGICGGLHAASGALDCTTYCCGNPETCTTVCPNNPSFVDRVREVAGFALGQLDAARVVPFPSLPSSVPIVYAKGRRREAFAPEAAALSLYQLVNRNTGNARFATRSDLTTYFGLDLATRIIASGTDKDPLLERWWQLSTRRPETLRQLRELGIEALTSPNFSVFSDVPRWDNFHAMRRIEICWREILDAGLPCALHVDARSARDWERWTEFARSREEVDAISYEFATGAAVRVSYHVDELRHLADRVNRPLKLLLRGALSEFTKFRQSYAEVTLLDSTTYMRTVNRKIAMIRERAAPHWTNAPDRPDVDLDALMKHNHMAMLSAAKPSR